MKILLGILIGFFIIILFLFGYRKVVSPLYTLSVPEFIVDTTKKRPSQEDIIALKSQLLTSSEKIESSNKRMDDILIFGGVIVTLLLAINVVVYVNAEGQVEKYFRENFEIHKKRADNYLAEIEKTAGKVKTELELTQNIRKQAEAIQTPQP